MFICVGVLARHADALPVPPARLTPPTLQPETPDVAAITLPDAGSLEAPPGSDTAWTVVGAVRVENAFADMGGANARTVAALAGRRLSVSDIYRIAGELEHDYSAAGYVLVRVSVPPQTLTKDQPLRLVIVDGFVEAIETSALPARARRVVKARLASLIGRRHVKLALIERRLLLAAAAPGLRLRSTLARGTQPGGTRLIIEGSQKLASGTLGADDNLPASLGVWEINSSLAVNNLLGLGEQVYASATTSSDLAAAVAGRSPTQILGVGAILPLGADGFTLNPEYTRSRTRPAPAAGAPASEAEFTRLAVRARYPLILDRLQSLAVQASVEHVDENLTAIGFSPSLYRDAYDAARLEVDWSRSLPGGGAFSLSGVFSRGLGGRTPQDATASGVPLSRQFAGPDFDKLSIDARYQQPLPWRFRLALSARAQTSFGEAQLVAEQFSLDGPTSVSAFSAGTFATDKGLTLRSELSRDIPAGATNLSLSPYGFTAFGSGEDERPTVVEARTVTVGAAGVGLRANLAASGPFPGGFFAVELGRQVSDVRQAPDRFRLAFSVGLEF